MDEERLPTATAPAEPSVAEPDVWERLVWAFHGLFAVTLLIPLAGAWDHVSTDRWLQVLGLVLAFAAWYWWWVVRHDRWWQRPLPMAAYFAGAAVFCFLLYGLSGWFQILLWSLYPQVFMLLGFAGGIGGALVMTATLLWRTGQFAELNFGTVVSLLGSVLLGTAVAAVIELVSRQNDRRQEIIETLEVTRGELAAAAEDNARLLAASRVSLAERSALYRASAAISVARTPAEILAAIGEHLAGEEIARVLLLRAGHGEQEASLALVASWDRGALPPLPDGLRLPASPHVTRLPDVPPGPDPADPPESGDGGPPLPSQRAATLPQGNRDAWDRHGLALVAFAALPDTGGDLLALVCRGEEGPAEVTRRLVTTVVPQAGLAVQNLRLTEAARTTGMLEERQRLAQEIHDTVAQGLTSVVTQLEAADQALPGADGGARRHLEQARAIARSSLTEVRRSVQALRPQVLEGVPLPEALDRVVAQWAAGAAVRAEMRVTGDPAPLHPEAEITLLRITQEALANVGKHARAGKVTLTLSYAGEVVLLDVADDGCGFETGPDGLPASRGDGHGLAIMAERARRLGGDVVVESGPGRGTTLAARLPRAAGTRSGERSRG